MLLARRELWLVFLLPSNQQLGRINLMESPVKVLRAIQVALLVSIVLISRHFVNPTTFYVVVYQNTATSSL